MVLGFWFQTVLPAEFGFRPGGGVAVAFSAGPQVIQGERPGVNDVYDGLVHYCIVTHLHFKHSNLLLVVFRTVRYEFEFLHELFKMDFESSHTWCPFVIRRKLLSVAVSAKLKVLS